MKRFVGGSLEDFERLFARGARASLLEADYPPGAAASSGPLRFRKVRSGGLIVTVTRCDIETDDFRLRTLFTTGHFPFPDALELARFFNGPVADAFGIEGAPMPDRLWTPEIEEMLQVRRRPREARLQKRLPTPDALAARLRERIHGQEAAIDWLASLVVSQLAKKAPRRPATALLVGPPGVGKTATLEALPDALAAEGWSLAHSYRIDCSELTSSYDVHRFLGATPGLVGYTETPPLVAALQKPGCILILDEIDKAHPDVVEALYALLDSGRVMTPDGQPVRAPGTIVAMTSATGFDELESTLHRVERGDRLAIEQLARQHLAAAGWPAELLSRIDTIAVYTTLDESAARRAAALAIHDLGEEYGFELVSVEQVLTDVVVDIADRSDIGARGLYYAARRLLADTFAAAAVQGIERRVMVTAGPPPAVSPAPD